MINITTNRLVLRNFLNKDAHGLFEYLAHPRCACFFDEKLNTIDQAFEYIHNRNTCSEEAHLAVCTKENDFIIGNVFSQKEIPDTYGVGWHFNKHFEGKGYAFEAAKAYIDFLFTYKNARRIYAYVEENNIRSKKLCERLKMRQEGLFLEFISFTKDMNGTNIYENTLIYAILKKEWNKEKHTGSHFRSISSQ